MKKVLIFLMLTGLLGVFSCRLGTCSASSGCTDEVQEAAENATTLSECESIVLVGDGSGCQLEWKGILVFW